MHLAPQLNAIFDSCFLSSRLKWPNNHTPTNGSATGYLLQLQKHHSFTTAALPVSITHPSHAYSFEILSLIQHCNILARRIWTIASIFYISSSITNSKKSLQNFITICRHKRVLPHELIRYFNPLNNLISEVRINKIILKLNFLGTWIRKTSWYMLLYGISFSHGEKEWAWTTTRRAEVEAKMEPKFYPKHVLYYWEWKWSLLHVFADSNKYSSKDKPQILKFMKQYPKKGLILPYVLYLVGHCLEE